MTNSSLTNVLEALEYQDDKGLVTRDTSDIDSERGFVWQEVKDKFGIHAAYFHRNVPVVYFREFQEFNDEALYKLHRSLWNHNRAPILIAVLPGEVRIYNCFALPALNVHEFSKDEFKEDSQRFLRKATLGAADQEALRRELSNFKRREIVSGRFAKEQRSSFEHKDRVDYRLLDNLREVRSRLIEDDLDPKLANRLLGRCIFVCYLEDRFQLGNGDSSKPNGKAHFLNLLERSKKEVYSYFEKLSDRFNGDLFPVDDTELHEVEERHLYSLGQFLSGSDMSSGQMCFWAYDFNCIPIELISAIYETFLDKNDGEGIHYTPPRVVDYVLGEILPFDTKVKDVKILDPACGSGIFLIEAYRRLVFLRSRRNEKLKFDKLCSLLRDSIFGVDVDEEAIGVATFSCYLALLDFLDPDEVRKDMKLPNLKGTNLLVKDFFDTEASFNDRRYDFIIGNPPWKREKDQDSLSRKFFDRAGYKDAGKQTALAFLWRVPELLADDGQACLLCPSMSVLYNRHDNYVNFRHEFFQRNWVTKVVDFSAFRHNLFAGAVAPMAAIFYRKDLGKENKSRITYIGLHRSPLSELLEGIVVYGDESKPIPYSRVFHHLNIWKMALWGAPRDLVFIDNLRRRLSTLEEVKTKRKWMIGQGVTVGDRKKPAPYLGKMRFVPTKSIENLSITSGADCEIGETKFERTREEELFQGPHVLIRGGVVTGGFLNSAFLPDDAVFKNRVYVVKGPPEDANHLKVLSAVLSSSLARYYHFLTSSEWGIERSIVLLDEYKDFPCPNFDENDIHFKELVKLVDRVQLAGLYRNWRTDLDRLVCKMYGLTPSEQQVMEDLIDIKFDLHYAGKGFDALIKSRAFELPSPDDLRLYACSYRDTFRSVIGSSVDLRFAIHVGRSSYRAVSFHLTSENSKKQSEENGMDVNDHLAGLEKIAIEKYSEDLYFLKNIRVYEGNKIHIVKPAERRFWTASAGYNDADSTIDELLRTDNSQQ
ncbi:MAG: N-6 DNA methylase [Caldilineaceae bacterium]|nr:N-6 DNA methylase [Caldilineaceae bacterium]